MQYLRHYLAVGVEPSLGRAAMVQVGRILDNGTHNSKRWRITLRKVQADLQSAHAAVKKVDVENSADQRQPLLVTMKPRSVGVIVNTAHLLGCSPL